MHKSSLHSCGDSGCRPLIGRLMKGRLDRHSCTDCSQGPAEAVRTTTGGGYHDEQFPAESIRNVAVVSNAGSGKTSLVEAFAYFSRQLPSPRFRPQRDHGI